MPTVLAPIRALLGTAPAAQAVPGQPGSIASRLNWLRAGVLGANDGIVSVAAVVVGVAGGTEAIHPILLAGLAALVGGALSMALGEYVSVSSQRDALRARAARGQTDEDPEDTSPWHAALASLLAFFCGGLLPFLTIVLVPVPPRIPVTFGAVLLALALTGWLGARFGDAPPLRATIRVVVGGAIALAVTFVIGALLGTTAA
ncbi:VIT1/CCC1 transporter family protein [Gryllotalpicola ginsengisoli]|uniref:VIT1/CCC1 transporter family protein n=1 Tax=Gryllotalpicola ginsengisoli TaxID=444608 RepID=UPI0003B47B09|nr:VIT1/CCC1 transporter family protein [Gryllotalpicola ginsengisoli]